MLSEPSTHTPEYVVSVHIQCVRVAATSFQSKVGREAQCAHRTPMDASCQLA